MIEKDKDFIYDPDLVCDHFYTNGGATWKGIG